MATFLRQSLYSWGASTTQGTEIPIGGAVNWQKGSTALELPYNCHSIVVTYIKPASGTITKTSLVVGFAPTLAEFKTYSFSSTYGIHISSKTTLTLQVGNAEQCNGTRIFWLWNTSTTQVANVYLALLCSNSKVGRNKDFTVNLPRLTT
jgi:hypothetical protein